METEAKTPLQRVEWGDIPTPGRMKYLGQNKSTTLENFALVGPEDGSQPHTAYFTSRHDAEFYCQAHNVALTTPALTPLEEEMLAALRGVMRVADRNTVEFDAARTAIANAIAKAQAAQADTVEG